MFRCDEEERDFTKGKRGTYSLSDRKLEYAGLMSIVHILEEQQILMNMGHPLFDNLRQGDWLLDYQADRLASMSNLQRYQSFMYTVFSKVKQVPLSLKPKYASKAIM